MKKTAVLVLILILFSVAFVSAEAPQRLEEGSFSYVNVPILKVMEQKDNYIVYYRQFGTKIGCVSIPREWFKQGQSGRTGYVKPLAKYVEPYISIFFENGEFLRMFMYLPTNKSDSVWGVYTGKNIPDVIDPVEFAHGK